MTRSPLNERHKGFDPPQSLRNITDSISRTASGAVTKTFRESMKKVLTAKPPPRAP